ncbi:MAG: major capsid protein [Arizlama microvirus]|nr:MAG: major capsid protein [Arizlama microvirus]
MKSRNMDMTVKGPQITQFNNIAPQSIPRSTFIRDFTRRTTFDADYLVPIFADEILPGDEVNLNMNALIRMSTPIKPVMDNLYAETFWFFVPNRLVWDNWVKLQGQQTNPGDSTAFSVPVLNNAVAPMSTTGFTNQSIYDYLGLPTLVTSLDTISALWNRAYDLIWNEWFRDENLQNSIAVSKGDGPDDPALYTLRKRNKRKDYITSCTTAPQKGPAIAIPIVGTAPITGLAVAATASYTNNATGFNDSAGTISPAGTNWSQNVDNTLTGVKIQGDNTTKVPAIYANLNLASAVSINQIRQFARYQQIAELDMRGGTRYVESIYSRFGVISPDFRLQRPELIGQGHSRINIYAVPQTAPTVAAQTPQGNLAAFGIAQIQGGHGCRYAATEHGMIIGMINVRADLTYQQKVPKMFLRQTRLDYYEPLLNGLGEQTVTNAEVVATGTSTDQQPWGYAERFAEYRYKDSEITGKFRSNDPQTLEVWHLSQELVTPALNSAFITEAVPMARVLAVTTEPAFLGDMFYNYRHTRPMPIRSNPGIDRL